MQAAVEAQVQDLLNFLNASPVSQSAKEFFEECIYTVNSLIWLYNSCQPPVLGESPIPSEHYLINKSFDIPYKWRGMLIKVVEVEGATAANLNVFTRLLSGIRGIEQTIFPHGVPHSAEQLEQLRAQQGPLEML